MEKKGYTALQQQPSSWSSAPDNIAAGLCVPASLLCSLFKWIDEEEDDMTGGRTAHWIDKGASDTVLHL